MRNKKGILSVVLTFALVMTMFSINKFNVNAEAENIQNVKPISAPADYFGSKIITTNGTSSISVSPDIAYISVGVVSESTKLSDAQADAKKDMKNVMESLKKLGLKDTEIKTTNFAVNPKYNYNKETGESKISGYTINNTVEITVNDLDRLGTIIDAVTVSGSNQIGNIRFALKNQSTVYNQALEVAVKDAKSKAKAIAKGLDVKEVTPVKVTETSASSPIVYDKPMMSESSAMDKTTISAGQLDVIANVSVEFSFE